MVSVPLLTIELRSVSDDCASAPWWRLAPRAAAVSYVSALLTNVIPAPTNATPPPPMPALALAVLPETVLFCRVTAAAAPGAPSASSAPPPAPPGVATELPLNVLLRMTAVPLAATSGRPT